MMASQMVAQTNDCTLIASSRISLALPSPLPNPDRSSRKSVFVEQGDVRLLIKRGHLIGEIGPQAM